jgi:hypothetical protein
MTGKGSSGLAKYRADHMPLTPLKAMAAKCAECMSDYVDGREDCGIHDCPLYPYMPYSASPREKRKVSGTRTPPGRFRPKNLLPEHSQDDRIDPEVVAT